jgi:hypothetical protein
MVEMLAISSLQLVLSPKPSLSVVSSISVSVPSDNRTDTPASYGICLDPIQTGRAEANQVPRSRLVGASRGGHSVLRLGLRPCADTAPRHRPPTCENKASASEAVKGRCPTALPLLRPGLQQKGWRVVRRRHLGEFDFCLPLEQS